MALQNYVFNVVYKFNDEPAFVVEVLARTRQGATKKAHDKMVVRGKYFTPAPSRELKLVLVGVSDI